MLRLSRPLTLALLWLAIALLPVRAWAGAVMPVGMAAHTVAADAAEPGEPHAATPCHEVLVDDGANDSAGPAGHAGCSMCDVCHSAAAPMTGSTPLLSMPPEARPRTGPAPGVECPVQTGPERPPRLLRS